MQLVGQVDVCHIALLTGDASLAADARHRLADERHWSTTCGGRSGAATDGARAAGRLTAGSRLDRLEDLVVATAAAVVAGQPLLDLGVRRVRRATKQVVAGQQLAGDAEAALDGALLEEGRLKPRQPAALRQALNGNDLAAVGLDGQYQARVDDAVVEPHRARPALADQTAFLRAGQVQVVTQRLEQRVVRLDRHRPRQPVERQRDVGHAAASSRSRACASARCVRTRSIASR